MYTTTAAPCRGSHLHRCGGEPALLHEEINETTLLAAELAKVARIQHSLPKAKPPLKGLLLSQDRLTGSLRAPLPVGVRALM